MLRSGWCRSQILVMGWSSCCGGRYRIWNGERRVGERVNRNNNGNRNSNGSGNGTGHVTVLPAKRSVGRPPRGGRSTDELEDAKRGYVDHHDRGVQRYLTAADREELERRTYHPDDFHVVTSDEQGHSSKIAGVRFHPTMANELLMLFKRDNFPFDSEVALIRWAVFEGMKTLYRLERAHGGVPNYIARLAAINRLSLQVEQNIAFEGTLQTLRRQVENLLAMGRREAAAMLISDVLVEVRQVEPASWRAIYMEEIERRWGGLVEGEKKPIKVKVKRK